ncbi:hypothetical protein [Enterococcus alishanensis]
MKFSNTKKLYGINKYFIEGITIGEILILGYLIYYAISSERINYGIYVKDVYVQHYEILDSVLSERSIVDMTIILIICFFWFCISKILRFRLEKEDDNQILLGNCFVVGFALGIGILLPMITLIITRIIFG